MPGSIILEPVGESEVIPVPSYYHCCGLHRSKRQEAVCALGNPWTYRHPAYAPWMACLLDRSFQSADYAWELLVSWEVLVLREGPCTEDGEL